MLREIRKRKVRHEKVRSRADVAPPSCGTSTPPPEPVCNSTQSAAVEIATLAKRFAAIHATSLPHKRFEEAIEKCLSCGSRQHVDMNCWKQLMCQHCCKQGHPSDKCFLVCYACGKVHDNGDCALEGVMMQLKMWYNPIKHAGILPPAIEEELNRGRPLLYGVSVSNKRCPVLALACVDRRPQGITVASGHSD